LLATAAQFPDLPLQAIVAISPSHVVWQAISEEGLAPDSRHGRSAVRAFRTYRSAVRR
jgi:hypothetical protein